MDISKLTFDLSKLTIAEYRALFDVGQKAEAGDEIVGKTCGLTGQQITELPYSDYRTLMDRFFDAVRNFTTEKNSPSAST